MTCPKVLLESLEYLLKMTPVFSSRVSTTRSGGDLGCSPYFGHGQGTEHFSTSNAAPSCPTTCGNSAFQKALHADTFTLGLDQFIEVGMVGTFFFSKVFWIVFLLKLEIRPKMCPSDGLFSLHLCDMHCFIAAKSGVAE